MRNLLFYFLIIVSISNCQVEDILTNIHKYQERKRDFVPRTSPRTKNYAIELFYYQERYSLIFLEEQEQIKSNEQKQLLRLMLDTGSNHNWVQSSLCEESCDLGEHYLTSKGGGNCEAKTAIRYQEEAFFGCQVAIKININQLYDVEIQGISIETHYGTLYGSSYIRDIDGVLSLGPVKENNFVNQLFQAKQIHFNTFSISKQRNPRFEAPESDATLTLGIDISKMMNQEVFFTSISKSYWILNLESSKIGNNFIFAKNEQEVRLALFDSSVSALYLPLDDFMKVLSYFQQINESCSMFLNGSLHCFWESFDEHPVFYLTFIENNFTKIVELRRESYSSCFLGSCTYLIKRINNSQMSNVWILGEAFMVEFEMVFDLELNRIALSDKLFRENEMFEEKKEQEEEKKEQEEEKKEQEEEKKEQEEEEKEQEEKKEQEEEKKEQKEEKKEQKEEKKEYEEEKKEQEEEKKEQEEEEKKEQEEEKKEQEEEKKEFDEEEKAEYEKVEESRKELEEKRNKLEEQRKQFEEQKQIEKLQTKVNLNDNKSDSSMHHQKMFIFICVIFISIFIFYCAWVRNKKRNMTQFQQLSNKDDEKQLSNSNDEKQDEECLNNI